MGTGGILLTYRPEEWLGLAARSESDQPHEWLPVMWVVRNRVEARGYPNRYNKVITQAYQFSYFNQFRGKDPSTTFPLALEGYAGECEGWDANDYNKAVEAASVVIQAPRSDAPFGPHVLNFWSPRSMVPAYSLPKWRWKELWAFQLPGIDPTRFLFAQRVRESHPLSANVREILPTS
jgi:hypothetical protein